MEDGIQRDGAAKSAGRRIERVQIRRGIAGWHLVPADPAHHPLLARLFGPDDRGNPPGPVVRDADRKPFLWESLADGLAVIRGAAKDCGVVVRVCGDMHRRPTLLLSERPVDPKAAEPMARPFDGLGGAYAGQWSIGDFYERYEEALRSALASGAPFDTGSFGCKKEIQYGRIWRPRRNGVVHVTVSAEVDEWPDLVDSAIWQAAGTRLDAGSGAEALEKLGLAEDEASAWIEAEAAQAAEFGPERVATRSATLAWNIGYDRLRERLDALADECDTELEGMFAGLVEHCSEQIGDLERKRAGS